MMNKEIHTKAIKQKGQEGKGKLGWDKRKKEKANFGVSSVKMFISLPPGKAIDPATRSQHHDSTSQEEHEHDKGKFGHHQRPYFS